MIAPTTSSSATQLMYCRPLPILPPRPSRNGSSIFLSAPPSPLSMTPKRVSTTRTPACAAGSVAASQSRQTSDRKSPLPGGLDSSSSSSPRLP